MRGVALKAGQGMGPSFLHIFAIDSLARELQTAKAIEYRTANR
jgi:hypothetical protein